MLSPLLDPLDECVEGIALTNVYVVLEPIKYPMGLPQRHIPTRVLHAG